jgi:hypothetical protein
MLQRCENPNNTAYKNYGARGISVCDEWHDYPTFKEWAMENGYSEELTLDRIDVNGNYEPSNCRWTTHSVQMSNRRPYVRKELWSPIVAIDADGNIVKRFDRIAEAIEWVGKDGTGISKALHGVQSTAYGYGWRFADAQ